MEPDIIVDEFNNAVMLANNMTGNNGGTGTNPIQTPTAAWAEEMELGGIDYSLPVELATQLGRELTSPNSGYENARFVVVRPVYGITRKDLKVNNLGNEFNNVTLEPFSKSAITISITRVPVKWNLLPPIGGKFLFPE